MKVLDRGRLHIAAFCVGIADRLIEDAVRFAKQRVQFGKPIAEHQLIQAMIADSVTEAYAGRAMVNCKLFCSEMVGRVADRAVRIHGGAGYVSSSSVEHFYRDVRLFRVYEFTSQIQQLLIARRVLTEA